MNKGGQNPEPKIDKLHKLPPPQGSGGSKSQRSKTVIKAKTLYIKPNTINLYFTD